ncbi:MAG: hypothetical protein KKC76_10960 [Proteobacteria bacterium]|nr:hypothetical protein [Pseudomonadota bacterium]MBU4294837.1 hypothetical protein [Pseudomonadota bacterium]MCG2749337.1 hypothetical protein [Desulfobulbaceae bacterium]
MKDKAVEKITVHYNNMNGIRGRNEMVRNAMVISQRPLNTQADYKKFGRYCSGTIFFKNQQDGLCFSAGDVLKI